MSTTTSLLEDGRVMVRVKSKRGTETRDEDEVIVQAVFDDLEAAETESERLTSLVEARMAEARGIQNPGGSGTRVGSASSSPSSPSSSPSSASPPVSESASTAGGSASSMDDASTTASESEYSKVYLGEGAPINGWTAVPKRVVFEQIAPLVTRHALDDDDESGIKVNFSKEVPISGWSTVDREVVLEEIEPLVRTYGVNPQTESSA